MDVEPSMTSTTFTSSGMLSESIQTLAAIYHTAPNSSGRTATTEQNIDTSQSIVPPTLHPATSMSVQSSLAPPNAETGAISKNG